MREYLCVWYYLTNRTMILKWKKKMKKKNWFHSDVDYIDTWKAMEKLVDLGLVKSIGVSNFNSQQIDRLLANCRIKPVHNQVNILVFKFEVNLDQH